jgi:hypothetical protein
LTSHLTSPIIIALEFNHPNRLKIESLFKDLNKLGLSFQERMNHHIYQKIVNLKKVMADDIQNNTFVLEIE